MDISKEAVKTLIQNWEKAVLESYVAQSMLKGLADTGQINKNWEQEFQRVVSLPEVANLIHEGFEALYLSLDASASADQALLDALSKRQPPQFPN